MSVNTMEIKPLIQIYCQGRRRKKINHQKLVEGFLQWFDPGIPDLWSPATYGKSRVGMFHRGTRLGILQESWKSSAVAHSRPYCRMYKWPGSRVPGSLGQTTEGILNEFEAVSRFMLVSLKVPGSHDHFVFHADWAQFCISCGLGAVFSIILIAITNYPSSFWLMLAHANRGRRCFSCAVSAASIPVTSTGIRGFDAG